MAHIPACSVPHNPLKPPPPLPVSPPNLDFCTSPARPPSRVHRDRAEKSTMCLVLAEPDLLARPIPFLHPHAGPAALRPSGWDYNGRTGSTATTRSSQVSSRCTASWGNHWHGGGLDPLLYLCPFLDMVRSDKTGPPYAQDPVLRPHDARPRRHGGHVLRRGGRRCHGRAGAARLHAQPPHSPTRHLCTTVSQHKGGAPEPLTRWTMQKVVRCIRTLMPVSVPEFQTAISLLPFVLSVHT
jgi:hypothetical protein